MTNLFRALRGPLLVVLAGLGGVAPAATAAEAPDFARALAAMDAGDFSTATGVYEAAVAAGAKNGHLFQNLGICYHRQKRAGDAIAAFLAARRFLPRDPDVAANLRHALGQIPDRLDAEVDRGVVGRVGFWLDKLTPKELAYAAAALIALWSVALASTTLVTRWRPARATVLALGVLPALAAVSATVATARDEPWGAVRQASAKVYSGPGAGNSTLFELREGAPFVVLDGSVAGYLQIGLSDGKKGWIARDAARVFALDEAG